MVNESFAKKLVDEYKADNRPVVIHSPETMTCKSLTANKNHIDKYKQLENSTQISTDDRVKDDNK